MSALDYCSPATPARNFCARVAAVTSLFLVGWYVVGGLKLVDVFYSGSGNSLNISAHRTWWYFIYGVGTAAALTGVSLPGVSQRSRGGNRVNAWATAQFRFSRTFRRFRPTACLPPDRYTQWQGFSRKGAFAWPQGFRLDNCSSSRAC